MKVASILLYSLDSKWNINASFQWCSDERFAGLPTISSLFGCIVSGENVKELSLTPCSVFPADWQALPIRGVGNLLDIDVVFTFQNNQNLHHFKKTKNKQKISCGFTIEILPQNFKIKCRMYKREWGKIIYYFNFLLDTD